MTDEENKYYELGKFEVLMTYKRTKSFDEKETYKATMELDKMLHTLYNSKDIT